MRSRQILPPPLMAAAAMVSVAGPGIAAAAAVLQPSDHGEMPVLEPMMSPGALLPLETGSAVPDAVRGLAPRPTPPPENPDLGFMELARRQVRSVTGYTMSPNTCGFISTSPAAGALTCGREGSTCSQSRGFIGCCSSSSCNPINIKTTCIPYSRVSSSSCDTSASPGLLCCSLSSQGFCQTYVQSRSRSPSSTLSLYICGSSSTRATLLDFPVDYTSTTSSSSSSSRSQPTPPSPLSSPITSSLTRPGTGASTGTPALGGEREQQQAQTPVGAIVGGVVGGLAVIALAAVAIVFVLRRTRGRGPLQQQQPAPPGSPMGPQTFPPTSPFQPYATGSSYLAPPPHPSPNLGAGGDFVPQGYPTAVGYMMPPQQHQQAGSPGPDPGGSPYNSVAGDSMFAYPSMTQHGGSPMGPSPSPDIPHNREQGAAYLPYHPSYSQQQHQQAPVEYKAWAPGMHPQTGPLPVRNRPPQEMA